MPSEKISSEGKIPLSPDMDFLSYALVQDPAEETEESPISFYCKDCEDFVAVEKQGKRLKFRCKSCKSDKVAFGTKKSLENFYSRK